MNFDLSEEQQMLSDTVARLFEAHAAVPSQDPASHWQDYADLGLLGLPFPSDLGGYGGGHEAVMLVMEAFGATLATAPYTQSVLLAGTVFALAGQRAALAAVITGRSKGALALFEPNARYRWDAPVTRALPSDGGWRLDGHKVAVLDAGTADLLIVPATTDRGPGLFAVPFGTPGVTRVIRPTPDGRGAADVRFSDVVLPPEAMLALKEDALAILARAIDGAIAASCAEAVGAMTRLLAITTDYLRVREQFGVRLGSFQVLQHRAADMLVAIEQARSITFHAVSMLDAAPNARSIAVAAAKALVNRASRFVGSEAIQLHGGMGLAAEYPAGRYFQRLTVLENVFGDTDHMLALVERGGGLAV